MTKARKIAVELHKWIEGRLGPILTVELVAGLLLSVGVVVAFAELSEEVVEGETHRVDRMALLWMNANLPGWLDEPMRAVTALGYYWVVLPLLAIAACAFYLKGLKISAVLLGVSTLGSIVLTTVLKAVFQRARSELFDAGYAASFYSFPSGHATVAVGFYGTLVLLTAWHVAGGWRWVVAATGIALVLLIGFSRLYLGVHYPTDILAGFLTAPLWVSAVGFALFLYRFLRGDRRRET
jgi:undecaprenyl-diphosphatase